MKKRFLLTLAAAAVCAAVCGCTETKAPEPYTAELFALDTVIDFTVYSENGEQVCGLAEQRITELEALLSVTDENSEISRINTAGGKPVQVSGDTYNVIKTAYDVSDDTLGCLEPTVYPIVKLWGFTTDEYRVPSQSEIDDTLSVVGYKRLELDDSTNTVTLPEGMELDLGAVAKGYISQQVKELMKENGVDSAVLSFGGNIQTIGSKNGGDWRIGVKYPFTQDSFIILSVGEKAIVTSATDQRYFTQGGVQYHHIIDPYTGYPADNGTVSVTVVCDDGARADALSTALFVMGRSRAEEYWREHGDFEYILLDDEDTVYITSGLKDVMTTSNDYGFLTVRYLEN